MPVRGPEAPATAGLETGATKQPGPPGLFVDPIPAAIRGRLGLIPRAEAFWRAHWPDAGESFADLQSLPHVVQADLSGQRSFKVPYIGEVTDRITLLNIFDRTNLIRPVGGIGVFQAAYGPRITVYEAVTIPLPAWNQ